MNSFFCSNLQAIINSIGIVFDIVGAWLVAWEVVNEFKGKKIDISHGVSMGTFVVGQHAKETNEFKNWENKKYKIMKWGIGFLTVGFLLQFVSNWILKFDSVVEFCKLL